MWLVYQAYMRSCRLAHRAQELIEPLHELFEENMFLGDPEQLMLFLQQGLQMQLQQQGQQQGQQGQPLQMDEGVQPWLPVEQLLAQPRLPAQLLQAQQELQAQQLLQEQQQQAGEARAAASMWSLSHPQQQTLQQGSASAAARVQLVHQERGGVRLTLPNVPVQLPAFAHGDDDLLLQAFSTSETLHPATLFSLSCSSGSVDGGGDGVADAAGGWEVCPLGEGVVRDLLLHRQLLEQQQQQPTSTMVS